MQVTIETMPTFRVTFTADERQALLDGIASCIVMHDGVVTHTLSLIKGASKKEQEEFTESMFIKALQENMRLRNETLKELQERLSVESEHYVLSYYDVEQIEYIIEQEEWQSPTLSEMKSQINTVLSSAVFKVGNNE